MTSARSILALSGLAALTLAGCGGAKPEGNEASETRAFTLASSAFGEGDELPPEFTCDGDGLSPPLRWANPPTGTKSYAVIMSDPDAPMGTFRHWGAYNIPAGRKLMKAGDGLPNAGRFNQVLNAKEERQYAPPCPPPGSGPHRYVFKVIALDTDMLELSSDSGVGALEEAARPRKLGEATLTATYARD